ncbi:MAG: pyridoxamine 5'-phosphate oxidase [Saprospiraceae bacterium]|nr:pyridoxamine 5'-phosphate oxidase [Saprospiraceae bacterium]
MPLDIEHLRQDYRLASLEISDVKAHPVDQFEKWFQEALNAGVPEPNAMTLATCTSEGRPSARIVLLKSFDEQGFSFYTNYNSRKGQDFTQNPYAALVFWWVELERQVRIEGRVEKVLPEQSIEYFQSRPKGSQIGAWASPQSQVIADRAELEQKVAALQEQYEKSEVLPRPEHWGGYLVRPDLLEFWQGRSNRLHDRIQYRLQEDKNWKIERLAP